MKDCNLLQSFVTNLIQSTNTSRANQAKFFPLLTSVNPLHSVPYFAPYFAPLSKSLSKVNHSPHFVLYFASLSKSLSKVLIHTISPSLTTNFPPPLNLSITSPVNLTPTHSLPSGGSKPTILIIKKVM